MTATTLASTAISTPPTVNGLSEVIDRYDVFFFDVWGVLHDGIKAYDGVIETLSELQKRKKTVLLLSNSPCLSPHVSTTKLTPMGITPDLYNLFLTSGDASNAYMGSHHSGQKVYTFWDDETPSAFDNLNLTRVYDIHEADFIFASLLPDGASFNDYQDVLSIALTRGIPFVCGNPDRVVGRGDEIHYCVGSLAQWYEEQGGTVIWYGKPYIDVYNEAWSMVKNPDKSRILAIGDSLITDVAGATHFGCDVLWNVTGIHWEEIQAPHALGQIDPNLVDKALIGHARPTGLLQGFKY